MNFLIALCVLALVALTTGKPSSRGCIYIDGLCYEECEEGTHSYSVGCDLVTPEPTCEQPKPVQQKYITCDLSACYCDSPTIRDTVSGKCVRPEECPKIEKKE